MDFAVDIEPQFWPAFPVPRQFSVPPCQISLPSLLGIIAHCSVLLVKARPSENTLRGAGEVSVREPGSDGEECS
jgi:hypothetical protein